MKHLSAILLLLAGLTANLAAQNVKWNTTPAPRAYECLGGTFWKERSSDAPTKVLVRDASNGNSIIEPADSVTHFSGNYALALNKAGDRWRIAAIIDKMALNPAQPVRKEYYTTRVPYFSEKLVGVANEKGMQGFLTGNGELSVKCKYTEVCPFKDGYAKVTLRNGTTTYVDAWGKEKSIQARDEAQIASLAMQPDPLTPDAAYTLYCEGQRYGYKCGDSVAIPAQFDEATPFYNGYALASKDGKRGLITVNTRFALKAHLEGSGDSLRYVLTLSGEGIGEFLLGKLKVQLVVPGATPVELNDKDEGSTTIAYNLGTVAAEADEFSVELYYDGLLQFATHHQNRTVSEAQEEAEAQKAAAAAQKERAAGGIVIDRVAPNKTRADKENNVYFTVKLRNTSAEKKNEAVTLYVNKKAVGKAIPVSLQGGKSKEVTFKLKVERERVVSVKAVLRNGKSRSANDILLKPFY